ncbi:hypothetical protein Rleg5DRAFT_5132 [Rhizobium leguminosarum bv. viciae WSM1455]|nr:hypothetical protein Rleg5DRAFT_5132 [Rhizobium leguminosarum bv. viciae WSM1455]
MFVSTSQDGPHRALTASAALLKVEPASFVEDKEEELSTLTKAIESMADVIKRLKPAADAVASKASE